LRRLFLVFAIVVFTTFIPSAVAIQSNATSPTDVQKDALIFFSTASFANAHLYGSSSDRRLLLIGGKYSRLLYSNRFFVFSFTPGVTPIAILSQPVFGNIAVSRAVSPFTHNRATYGLGADPFGVEVSLLPRHRITPYVGTDEGFLYFSRNVPSESAAQFNFTIDVTAGVKIPLNGGREVSFAYMIHHFSNGYEAEENPGLDSQMFYFGYGFSLNRHHSRHDK
jgi:Lipid A 3-O-deacylase (PagL)